MIDYAELVSALDAWRHRQGLQVGSGMAPLPETPSRPALAARSAPPAPPPGAPRTMQPAPGSGPVARPPVPGSGPIAEAPARAQTAEPELLADDSIEDQVEEVAAAAADDDQGGLVEAVAIANFGDPTTVGEHGYDGGFDQPVRTTPGHAAPTQQRSNVIDIDLAPTTFGDDDER